MDKYTKFILTLIAVGILGINFHLFKGEIIKEAYANTDQIHKIVICNESGKYCGYGGRFEFNMKMK
jgi:hypothetical protein